MRKVSEGKVIDTRAKRSPNPSAGLEVKLMLMFRGLAPLTEKMKVLIRQSYHWDYIGVSTGQDQRTGKSDDEDHHQDDLL